MEGKFSCKCGETADCGTLWHLSHTVAQKCDLISRRLRRRGRQLPQNHGVPRAFPEANDIVDALRANRPAAPRIGALSQHEFDHTEPTRVPLPNVASRGCGNETRMLHLLNTPTLACINGGDSAPSSAWTHRATEPALWLLTADTVGPRHQSSRSLVRRTRCDLCRLCVVTDATSSDPSSEATGPGADVN